MDLIAAIGAGLLGTAVALVLLYAASLPGWASLDLLRRLGAQFATDTRTAHRLGIGLVFALGMAYALLYALLWSAGIGEPTWFWGLVFGAVHSAVAIRLLRLRVMRKPPEPAEVPLIIRRMVSMWLLHVPFAVVVAVAYRALQP